MDDTTVKNYNKLIIGAIIALVLGGVIYFFVDLNKQKVRLAQEAEEQRLEEERLKEEEVEDTETSTPIEEIPDEVKQPEEVKVDPKPIVKPVPTPDKPHGSFTPYSPEKLASATASGRVLLYFHAGWCPVCKQIEKNILANIKTIPEDLTIIDVDYDASTELRQKYGVTYQHTFVQIDKDGNLIKKWTSHETTLKAILGRVI